VDRGYVTPALLGSSGVRDEPGVKYLEFADPLDLPNLTALLFHQGVERLRGQVGFRPTIGRLARVGYASRILAAVFSLSLFVRGRVPGDAAAAALLATRRMRALHDESVYYGRVVRDASGWVILQYWYFYAFDNWRSGFFGANDHEADWEMVSVYAYRGSDGEYVPCWAAYSCHDFTGGDLRRRWDDHDDLTLEGDHPVVYVGVGSHAGYFRRGDYLAEIDLPIFAPLAKAIAVARQVWVGTLHQAGVSTRPSRMSLFRIPFVDYARGDGRSIGPGQDNEWAPVLLDPAPGWLDEYRGLWGLHARDPLSGEDAPAGPAFNRDGSPRRSWEDPLGWVGLDGQSTPPAELASLARRRVEIHARQLQIEHELVARIEELGRIHVDLTAVMGGSAVGDGAEEMVDTQRRVRQRVAELRHERHENTERIRAIEQRHARLSAGIKDAPRSHIGRVASPVPPPSYRLRRVTELWSALSIAAFLAAVLGAYYVDGAILGSRLFLIVVGFLLVDATLRGQFESLITGLSIILAVSSAGILLVEWWWQIGVIGLVVAVLYLGWTNVREVFR
jgi:hypothetical protein